jgi:hypothetical protein
MGDNHETTSAKTNSMCFIVSSHLLCLVKEFVKLVGL